MKARKIGSDTLLSKLGGDRSSRSQPMDIELLPLMKRWTLVSCWRNGFVRDQIRTIFAVLRNTINGFNHCAQDSYTYPRYGRCGEEQMILVRSAEA
jgi:hypothetical protein